MVGDPEGDPAVVQALVHLLQVIEVRHPPRDVIQADLPLLLPLRVVPDLEQRDVVSVAWIAGEKRRPHPVRAGEVEDVLRVQAKDVRIPAVRALGVADEDVDVIESNGLAGHGGCLLVPQWSKYRTRSTLREPRHERNPPHPPATTMPVRRRAT